jgi:ubiquinone/menaquinone biosynthesis C-methylase UbiE
MKYDAIGIGYDSTRRPDLRIAARIQALLEPRAGGHYLDVACGTGNYTITVKIDAREGSTANWS